MLRLQNVTKKFPASPAGIHEISFSVESGECVALLGPSGSGKTTLLRLIAGLEMPDSGTIYINGIDVKNIPPHQRGIAFAPQKPSLYPQMTIASLVENAVAKGGSGTAEGGKTKTSIPPSALQMSEVISLLKLETLLNRRPHELSGGEKQRVSLARAVVRGASIWLLDEPFAPLDPPFRTEFRHLLHLIATRCSATIVFVTHDPIDAWALGRRVGVLGDGRLQCLGPPEELAARPGNRFVAFCLGRFCFIDGTRQDHSFVSDEGSVKCVLPSPVITSSRLTLGIRPREMTRQAVVGSAVEFRGWTTTAAVPDGSGWLLTLSRGTTQLIANWPHVTPPPLGELADWWCPLERCEWFDGVTGNLIAGL